MWRQIKRAKNLIESILDTELNFYAASLSFYTIFALVPLLLVVLSIIATLPNFHNLYLEMKQLILSNLIPTNEEVVSSYLDTFLQNSSKLGELGFISILITSVFFFKNFQYIAAKIFQSKVRDFWNSITIYWTLVTLLPIGIGISIFLSGYVQNMLASVDMDVRFFTLSPFLITAVLFFIVFKISANKPLSNWAVGLAAFVVAMIWMCSKWFFVAYVFYNKAYLTIYGSFSILLFFLLWIYVSWLIILYGMRLCEWFSGAPSQQMSAWLCARWNQYLGKDSGKDKGSEIHEDSDNNHKSNRILDGKAE